MKVALTVKHRWGRNNGKERSCNPRPEARLPLPPAAAPL